jgi:hypothetical protein
MRNQIEIKYCDLTVFISLLIYLLVLNQINSVYSLSQKTFANRFKLKSN